MRLETIHDTILGDGHFDYQMSSFVNDVKR